jgi:hypothetical protein
MERDKFSSTSLLLKPLKKHEKCIFMVYGRGGCQNGRGFGLKWHCEGLAAHGNTACPKKDVHSFRH